VHALHAHAHHCRRAHATCTTFMWVRRPTASRPCARSTRGQTSASSATSHLRIGVSSIGVSPTCRYLRRYVSPACRSHTWRSRRACCRARRRACRSHTCRSHTDRTRCSRYPDIRARARALMARWPTDGLNHHGMHAGETRGETDRVRYGYPDDKKVGLSQCAVTV
jgi:hypothetical protein